MFKKFFRKKYLLISVISITLLLLVGFLIYIGERIVTPPIPPNWEESVANLDIDREHYFIQSDDLKLEAELFIPKAGESKKAAVVFSPGSGNVSYQWYGSSDFLDKFIHDVFLSRDIAVLYVNKRGIGESEGSWKHNDFQGRVDDIYSAVKHLQNHSSIDPQKIGLIGHSQGGWIASLAASQHQDIAFFISLAGPSTTVFEQIEHTRENELYCQGYRGEELETKLNRKTKLTKFLSNLGRFIPVGDLDFLSKIIQYDPRDDLKKIEQPGLFIFGDKDYMVPADKNLNRFEEIFEDGLPKNLTVEVLNNAEHGFNLVEDMCVFANIKSMEEYDSLRDSLKLSDELPTVLTKWLEDNGY